MDALREADFPRSADNFGMHRTQGSRLPSAPRPP